MTREEFINQRCEIDKITEEEFEKRYRIVKCNCGAPYCKGYRCLDLDDLLKENQKLKAELQLYQGALKREHEAIHRVNDLKEVIDKANKKLNNFIECCKAEKLESGSDYLHHQYWDMFERFNKQIKDILKEVSK